MTYSEGCARDQRAEVLWASTISIALTACPHNVRVERWWSCGSRRRGSLGALVRRAEKRLREDALRVLVQQLTSGPSSGLVSPPHVWVVIDAEASALDQTVAARERGWRRGVSSPRDLGGELARREAWLETLDLVERLRPLKAAMEWLGERFYLAAVADPGFLKVSDE